MPRDLWGVFLSLEKIQGYSGIVRPWFKGIECEESWFFIPKCVEDDLFDLDSIASRNSYINVYIENCGTDDFWFLPSLFCEVESLAHRDGLPVTYKTIEDIWLKRRRPANDYERVVANLSNAFYTVKPIASRRFSRMVIEDAYSLVTRGIGELDLVSRPHFEKWIYLENRLKDAAFVSDQLDALVDHARESKNFQNAILSTIMLTNNLWDLPYVPMLKSLTEFLVRRIYLLGQGLPALAYVPFSYEEENGSYEYLRMHEAGSTLGTSNGINCTWLIAGDVKAYLHGAQDLLKSIHEIQQKDNKIRTRLERLSDINARQKDFVFTVTHSPMKKYRIQDYIDKYKIAYATSYADLLDLVQRGLLSYHKEGRAFVFQAITDSPVPSTTDAPLARLA